ncbi:hypothetical protein [Caenimonas soli]|uniref:hypothetical protein n=1 Tax=Caenimonas soli TaxID=2735555 RepID=UPI0015576A5D|nr:hypothetical protein [Caenimonas soli]NPC59138.1 hypothetical protein [Caenimonas soli]
MSVACHQRFQAFYAKVLGRAPNGRAMPTLVLWRGFSETPGFEDASRARNGRMTIVTPDLVGFEQLLKS